MPPGTSAERSTETSMVALKPSKWALIIGIDYYDHTDSSRNLHGCVRDAQAMANFFQTQLGVDQDKIRMLLGSAPTETNGSSNKPLKPTREDILNSIAEITNESCKDDYVHIHFSGHGARAKTVYPKQGDTSDEALLCADGNIIRDVELGVLLEKLVKEKNIVLSVTLDCCHSGGALRDDEKKTCAIREQTPTFVRSDTKWIGLDQDELWVNTESRENWFWKKRDYNLIAACQPHEPAMEFTDDHDERRGLLTFYLLECLSQIRKRGSLKNTSYHTLMRMLQGRCHSKNHSFMQSPVLFGEERRPIFEPSRYLIDNSDIISVTRVEIDQDAVVLCRGAIDNVALGDKYQLVESLDTNISMEVEVVEIEAFQCWAQYEPGTNCGVQEFWFAKPLRQAYMFKVTVLPSDQDSSIVDLAKEEWNAYDKGTFPLMFDFGTPDQKSDFYIKTVSGPGDDGPVWDIRNREGPVPNIPRISATEKSKTMGQLCDALDHLGKYFVFEKLRPERRQFDNLSWEFSVEVNSAKSTRSERREKQEKVADGTIRFKNNTGRLVYIAVFNLAPDWSVTQLIPEPEEGALPVDPGNAIPEYHIDFVVPDSFQNENRPKTMKDTFKLIVSDDDIPHNLSHYQLPAIGSRDPNSKRNAKRSIRPSGWDVDHQTVEVKLPEQIYGRGEVIRVCKRV